jgi:hypothetical protein
MIVAMPHEKRRFVEKVDFVTSPGFINGDNTRAESGLPTGGMMRVVTDLALFGFDEKTHRMKVMALHPGVTREQVQDNTGFALIFDDETGVTAPPSDQELKVLRELDPEQLYTARPAAPHFKTDDPRKRRVMTWPDWLALLASPHATSPPIRKCPTRGNWSSMASGWNSSASTRCGCGTMCCWA